MKQQGVLLVEVMLSLLLFSIFFLGFIKQQRFLSQRLNVLEERLHAHFILMNVFELYLSGSQNLYRVAKHQADVFLNDPALNLSTNEHHLRIYLNWKTTGVSHFAQIEQSFVR